MSATPALKTVTGGSPRASILLTSSRLLMLVLVSGIYLYYTPQDQPFHMGFALLAMAVFTINHLLYFRNVSAFWWLMSLDMVVVALFGFVYLGETVLYQILFGVLGMTVLIHTADRRKITLWLSAVLVVWGAIIWTEYRVLGKVEVITNLLDLSFFLFTCVVGSLIRFYQDTQTKMTHLYTELGKYARQVELLTATRERNYIAREIHDTVGHTMTSLLVQLQVARKLQAKDPSASVEALLRCEELARSALQEVRLSVRTLQAEGEVTLSLLDSLRQLAGEFSQLSEVETELAVEGLPARVPTTLEPVIYRIVQEALTNAKRHGQATWAKVDLCCTAEEVRLEIVDNGVGAAHFTAGFGLMQMKERVHEQGGTVTFSSGKERVHEQGGSVICSSSDGEGFAVRVNFPLHEQTWRYGGGRG